MTPGNAHREDKHGKTIRTRTSAPLVGEATHFLSWRGFLGVESHGSKVAVLTECQRPESINQYWSALRTSPLARVPSAHQGCRPIESLTNFTDPSAKARLTPPGWLLVGGAEPEGLTK